MARLIGFLATIFILAACSSGVSNSGAGGPGTDCSTGALGLICTADITLASPTLTACSAGEEGPVANASTDTGILNIIIRDPLGEFSNTVQGFTFNNYRISYASGQGGAPNLGTRQVANTLSFTLNNSVGQGAVVLPILDATNKKMFADQASCSTTFPYQVTVRAIGTDFVTNTQIVIVARINIGIGGSAAENGEEEGEEEVIEEEV